ncbi:hypothetical protein BU16DRAFT_594085 [Lophium mytilinum]|uniref:Uncharacterized protein n=1 Tax=Lophium mytilinum TaxID=390894 RepID=A0A6A6QL94_9PEZI|nr:hypothetical protein BU16DRAFT_594085 [Lophium mytilinum]
MFLEHLFLALTGALFLSTALVSAQRPSSTPICDYYAETILGANTEANQRLLMVLLLHTTVLGNYTTPNTGIAVHGIAAPGTFRGQKVNLIKYFTGEIASTNNGTTPHGVPILLLDGGGAAPLLKNVSSYNTSSLQYHIFDHIEQYFGTLLGCSKQGGSALPAYQGRASMYEVHKFMDLSAAEMGWFNLQATLAIASLGFSKQDVGIVNDTLYNVFSQRCSPAVSLVPKNAGPQLQSLCINEDCPLDKNATCALYPNKGVGVAPEVVNATNASASGTGTVTGTAAVATSTGAVFPSRTVTAASIIKARV